MENGNTVAGCAVFVEALRARNETDVEVSDVSTKKRRLSDNKLQETKAKKQVTGEVPELVLKALQSSQMHIKGDDRGGRIVVIEPGWWNEELKKHNEAWVMSGEDGLAFPLRCGATWIKQFRSTSKHASAVPSEWLEGDLQTIWIKFTVSKDRLNQPVFEASLYSGRSLTAQGVKERNLNDLEREWIQSGGGFKRGQNGAGDSAGVADRMKGARFTGLSNDGLCEYFRSITKEYCEKPKLVRALGKRTAVLSSRYARELGNDIFKRFTDFLESCFPGEPTRAFDLLQSNNNFARQFDPMRVQAQNLVML